MNSNWLLVFKEDLVSQPVPVQKALFEQYVLLVLDVPGLAMLEETAATTIVRDAFLQSLHLRFNRMHTDDITELLLHKVSEAVRRHHSPVPLPAGKSRHCRAAALLQGWTDVEAYLSQHKNKRLRLRTWRHVAGLAILLLLGGLLFSAEGTQREVYSSPEGTGEDAAVKTVGDVARSEAAQLISMKVNERNAGAYADLTLVTPTYLPTGYSFHEGEVWLYEGQSKGEHAVLTYSDAEQRLLRISFLKLHPHSSITSSMFAPATSKEVFLRGKKCVLLTSTNGQLQLSWIEHDDTYIILSGRQMEEQQFLRMAESLN